MKKTKTWIAITAAVLVLSMFAACGGKSATSDAPANSESTAVSATTSTPHETATTEPNDKSDAVDATGAPAESQTTDSEPAELVDGMRPEFKEAMDSYEGFYDSYCDFMQKYSENPTDMALLAEYAQLLAKTSDMDKKFDAWEEDDLNDAEMKYYLEVSGRISQKLLEAAQTMQ